MPGYDAWCYDVERGVCRKLVDVILCAVLFTCVYDDGVTLGDTGTYAM